MEMYGIGVGSGQVAFQKSSPGSVFTALAFSAGRAIFSTISQCGAVFVAVGHSRGRVAFEQIYSGTSNPAVPDTLFFRRSNNLLSLYITGGIGPNAFAGTLQVGSEAAPPGGALGMLEESWQRIRSSGCRVRASLIKRGERGQCIIRWSIPGVTWCLVANPVNLK